MPSSPGSTGSANKEARRGKTRRRHLLCTAMALRPGLVFAEVVGYAFCPLAPSRRPHCLLHRRSRPTKAWLTGSYRRPTAAKCAWKRHSVAFPAESISRRRVADGRRVRSSHRPRGSHAFRCVSWLRRASRRSHGSLQQTGVAVSHEPTCALASRMSGAGRERR